MKVVSVRYPREPDATVPVEHDIQRLITFAKVAFVLRKHLPTEIREQMQALIIATSQRSRMRGIDFKRVGDERINQTVVLRKNTSERLERMTAVDENIAGRHPAKLTNKRYEGFRLVKWLSTRDGKAVCVRQPCVNLLEHAFEWSVSTRH